MLSCDQDDYTERPKQLCSTKFLSCSNGQSVSFQMSYLSNSSSSFDTLSFDVKEFCDVILDRVSVNGAVVFS
jgi:hypothetical protein